MTTAVENFAKVTVSTTYDAVATSIVLTAGHGSRLPSTFPYPLVWWDATTYADPADDPNKEIVTVTNRVTDTLTVTRGAESSGASTKNTASKTYKMVQTMTKAMWNAITTSRALSQTFRGLALQTHPDSDKSQSQVRLMHADAIVMSDGEEVANWNDVDFNIAAATGIGGLDTGSEAASTWYELYAMWNGTAKGLMGHRAKDYKLDTSYTTGEDASQGLRSAVDNSTVRVSQGIQFATAGPLEFIDVKLLKTGTPTGNYWFTIEANSGGVPSNTPLATSRKMDVSRLQTTAAFARIVFDAPFSVSAATQYHLVMYGDYTVSAANFASWRMDGSAGAYASGSKALFDSDTSTWTIDTDDDMQFKAYVSENDTALTVPSGYRYALIGYVYNNASSNFKFFYQRDRHVCCGQSADWLSMSGASGTYLVDLFAFVPPVNVSVDFICYNASSGNWAFGTYASTDVSGVAATEIVGSWKVTNNTGFTDNVQDVPVEYQGMMLDVAAAGTFKPYISSFDF